MIPDIAQIAVIASTSGTVSEEDLQMLEQLAEQAKLAMDEKQRAMDELANEIASTFSTRMGHRAQKEAEWTVAQELYMGKLAEKRTHYMFPENVEQRDANNRLQKYRVNIVRPKVDAVVSQLVSAQFGSGEKNWCLKPSAVPQIDTNVDPAIAVGKMEDVIEDQLEETDYVTEYKAGIEDMAVLGTIILKGPVNAGKLKKIWAQELDPMTGQVVRKAQLVPEYVPCIKRVNPWFFFPDHTVTKIEDSTDAIEVHPMSRRDLQRLMNHPGYFADSIQKLLENPPSDLQSHRLAPVQAFTNSELFKGKYLVLERHGPVDRDMLNKIGIDLPFSDDRQTFWAEAWACDGKLIRLELSNLETADSVPYAVDVWEEDPSSIFGFGLPLLVEDQQRISDGIWNAIVLNAKLTSGPQVGVNRAMVQPMKDGSHDIEPWKVWFINEYGADIRQALQFTDIPSRQEELAAVLNMAKGFADEEASIPPLLGGLEAPELSAGATGTAMVYKNATTMLHARSQSLDDRVTSRVIEWMYDWNMQYNPDESIKGDYEVDVRSSTAYLRQHMELMNLEKLINQTSQNPELQKIVKIEEAVKAMVTNMQLPAGNLVRNATEVQQYMQQMQQNQQPDPKMMEMQIKQQELELEKQKLELEKQKMMFEMTMNQERAQMDYLERQEANDARIAEAESSVIKEQLRRDQELTKFAARNQLDREKLLADINIKQRDQAIEEFKAGIAAEIDANKLVNHEKEMELRRQTGQGV